MADKKLTAGLEDYLEAIYLAASKNKSVKGIDIAKMLNISRASVSEALAKLVSKGLITYESYGTILFTSTGLAEAKKVYNTHNTLKLFFQTVLNISPEEASKNACKIEHIISDNILIKIKNFTDYCNNHPEIIDNFRQEKDNERNLSDREIPRPAGSDSKSK